MIDKSAIAVLGFGVTGQSVVRHLLGAGIMPIVCDTRPAPAQLDEAFADVSIIWECDAWPALDVSEAVVSPGLALDSCLVSGAVAAGVRLLSDIDLFFRQADAPVIGITGTNGKSTVTSLVGHLLNQAGLNCGVGGNLGEAALDLLNSEREAYVLELSSFQLQRSQALPLHSAAVLNVSEDHLDVHGSMGAYTAHKLSIFRAAQRLVFNRQDAATIPPQASAGQWISFGLDTPDTATAWGVVEDADGRFLARGTQRLMAVKGLPLTGEHNVANALAACALVEDLLTLQQMAAGLASFQGLAHRFATVAQFDGITWINDSKATNLGATQAALAGLPAAQQVLLIAGGDAKGVDLSPLAQQLAGRVRRVFCIGKDAMHLAEVAALAGVAAQRAADLDQAVADAAALAREGDMVLLSPACASLDMFRNFEARGQCFEQAVVRLQEQRMRRQSDG